MCEFIKIYILIDLLEPSFYSGSSAGDLGDVTPCNASPNLSALMPFRQVVRDDAEEIWRQQIQSLITQAPYNTLSFFQLLSKILRVSIAQENYIDINLLLFRNICDSNPFHKKVF